MAQPSSDTTFIPRKEFLRAEHTYSSFSLLTLSSSNLIRLYCFPPALIGSLRRYLNFRGLLSASREDVPHNYHEFTLEGKPWSAPKSLDTEILIVDVIKVLLAQGFLFLSTIDYGREADDKLAMAFSKPHPLLDRDPMKGSNSNLRSGSPMLGSPTLMSGSNLTLSQQGPGASPRIPFAVSFPSATILRVISPPLNSTPAILQAVRGSWPRGVMSEKKVGDRSYEFKLKGYRWFQEDTFATDSLNQILSLLTSLDVHAFTLLASLALSSRSRVKDLWIFTGPGPDPSEEGDLDSVRASSELSHFHIDSKATSPQQLNPRRLASSPSLQLFDGSPRVHPSLSQTQLGHRRAATEGAPSAFPYPGSSAMRIMQSSAALRKQSPLGQAHPVYGPTPRPDSTIEEHRIQLPSAVSSTVDMTGIGSAVPYARPPLPTIASMTPSIIYTTDGGSQDAAPREPDIEVYAMPEPTPPVDAAEPMPMPMPISDSHLSAGTMPPLLSSVAFRDSAFSTGSGNRESGWTGTDRAQSCEVFVKWVGGKGSGDGDLETRMGRGVPEDIAEETHAEEEEGESQFPGAWGGASAEGGNGGQNSELLDDASKRRTEHKVVDARVSAPQIAVGIERRSEAGVVGIVPPRLEYIPKGPRPAAPRVSPSTSTPLQRIPESPPPVPAQPLSPSRPSPSRSVTSPYPANIEQLPSGLPSPGPPGSESWPPKKLKKDKDTKSEGDEPQSSSQGWVWVTVEGRDCVAGQGVPATSGKGKNKANGQLPSPGADSPTVRSKKSGKASMSAAVKTIAMIDAAEHSGMTQESPSSSSKKKLFGLGRSRDRDEGPPFSPKSSKSRLVQKSQEFSNLGGMKMPHNYEVEEKAERSRSATKARSRSRKR
ncbi:hypothetical protein JAAARDRAFT_29829 [Jaapia argillacea MUCL 33604]|uniref:Uncharacterized protein n=1 Tax=Jaapia argillacea MUCL 33604 TaxID=933084 RepID=A0A067Q9Y1_9AGAM|nr:hypothetical protein JAAARDRAFT_29829 [Jaapia argillacea MUCL 33604]